MIVCRDDRLLIRLFLKITFDSKSKQKVYRLWDDREREFGDLVDQLDWTVIKNEGFWLFRITITYELMAKRFDRLFGVKLTLDEVIRMACLVKMNSVEIENRKSSMMIFVFIKNC